MDTSHDNLHQQHTHTLPQRLLGKKSKNSQGVPLVNYGDPTPLDPPGTPCTPLYFAHCSEPNVYTYSISEAISVCVSQHSTKGVTVLTALTHRCTAAWSTCPNWSTNLPL